MNIVIVDDEEDIGFILSFELKLAGHEAACFTSAEIAQQHIQENISKVEVIICDFQMPHMNGL